MTLTINDFKKQFQVAAKKIQDNLNSINSNENLQKIAPQIVTMMQSRVRRGFGVDKSGDKQKKFTPLSKSYIEYRAGRAVYFKHPSTNKTVRVEKSKKTSMYFKFKTPINKNVTSVSRSNLSLTGQMIDSIKYSILNSKIKLYLSNPRAEKLAGFHETGSKILPRRRFFHLSDMEIKKIKQMFQLTVSSALRELIKK